jgi:hypothetical protein
VTYDTLPFIARCVLQTRLGCCEGFSENQASMKLSNHLFGEGSVLRLELLAGRNIHCLGGCDNGVVALAEVVTNLLKRGSDR